MSLLLAAVVGAAVQIFDGQGHWHTNDDDNQQIAMARTQQRAELDAQKKAGMYLQSFSRTVNAAITDDEINAVTANIIEPVGDVHFDKKIIPLNETQTTILYTATLKARIDPDGIFDFIKRNDKEKVTIVQQTTQAQDAIQENDSLTEKLTDQYNKATTQAKRDRIRKQLNDADRDFLANQKLEEGNKLYYAKDYDAAIKLYNATLEFGDYFEVYNNRGNAYDDLGNYDAAIKDYDKAVKLDPSNVDGYRGRGICNKKLGNESEAQADFAKVKQLGG